MLLFTSICKTPQFVVTLFPQVIWRIAKSQHFCEYLILCYFAIPKYMCILLLYRYRKQELNFAHLESSQNSRNDLPRKIMCFTELCTLVFRYLPSYCCCANNCGIRTIAKYKWEHYLIQFKSSVK